MQLATPNVSLLTGFSAFHLVVAVDDGVRSNFADVLAPHSVQLAIQTMSFATFQ
ncbi:hypothetical protein D3C81_2131670 [compost metagenome]